VPEQTDKPNVVFVITDDQGYGDLGCHGNPIIQTPNLDRLHSESLRLTNFHVGPTCAPTRAGLMTGRYCNCTGVWHTIMGRSILRRDEVTIADVFRAGGYRTGMFGKWHLGDNHPCRPHERGFDEALFHGGGGVSQTPDYWGNDYFADTYQRNGVHESFDGYCTDVWFDEAMAFIERQSEKAAPFFCYLATNAPHGPYRVAESYSKPYRGQVPDARANFYGMITCIDDNMARLRAKLDDLGIADNTILIFMTDNGTCGGCQIGPDHFVTDGFNAGMRGKKGSEYDGGHRTPLFLRWPAGGMAEGRDVSQLTANIDMLPTLADLCGIDLPDDTIINGVSIAALLRGEDAAWPDRVVVTDSQRIDHPAKWRKSATMTQRWRLVNGSELYDVLADPGQLHNVAADHPDVAEDLREHYEAWWDLVSARFDEYVPIVVGSEDEPIARITSHDWHGENCAWNQGMIREGTPCNGFWAIDVAEAGDYEFELRRWPKEEDRAITDGIEGDVTDWYTGGNALPLTTATLRVGSQEQTAPIAPHAKGVTFTLSLKAGQTRMETCFANDEGLSLGAYFVYVRRIA